ncbi:hypothetical protein ACH4SP_10250 [Streptomyces sp. NPDC021093]|uniref:hypothetical protein n=1 Tax=Streptomyces sp. NPDC021093 TaxID=3365112 RepID=UPI0037B085AE
MLRKAFTASAVTVVTAAVLAVPATAFADAPSPGPAATSSTQQTDDQQQAQVPSQVTAQGSAQVSAQVTAQVTAQLSSPGDPAGFRAGEVVTIAATTSGNASGGVTASSSAFGTTHLAPTDGTGSTWAGTATISKNAGIGTLPVKIVADYGDTGTQATANILVNTVTTPDPDPTPDPTPTPVPQQASLALSTDGGKPGDRVQVTIDGGDLKGSARIESGAFGGSVNLTPEEGTSSWHGTATVSAHTKPGYYRVDGYVGNQKVDSVKFGIADAVINNPHHHKQPHRHLNTHHNVAPVNVESRKIPKGAVNAGASDTTSSTSSAASAASSAGTGLDTGLIAGAAGLSAAVLLGGTVLWRRRHQS